MKKIFTLAYILIIFSNCLAQNFRLTLIGSWKEIEYHGNDGAKDYLRKIDNGRILTFENSNVVKDGNGNKGIYEIKGDSLHILLPKNEKFYLFYFKKNNTKRIGLSPVTEKYEIICDEGCSEVYEKLDTLKILNSKIIKGFVLDNSLYTKTKVPFVETIIEVEGTNRKTLTDNDGKFEIEVVKGDTLIVSRYGIKRKIKILVTDRNCYKVDLNTVIFEPSWIGLPRKFVKEQKKLESKMLRKIKEGFYDCPDE